MQAAIEPEKPIPFCENPDMGRVMVDVKLINSHDEEKCEEGLLKPDQVRQTTVRMLVDTGSTLLSLPEAEIQKLGLRYFKEMQSRYANGQVASRKIYGPVTIEVQGRKDSVLAMAGHPGLPALLGQIPLEGLDLMVDSKRLCLVPGHPESPDVQMVEVY